MSNVTCKYCGKIVKIKTLDIYECEHCKKYAHFLCMDSKKPSTLKGDFLFSYECKECSFDKKDCLTRAKGLNWVQLVHLALYNLSITECGRQGYFRWKEEICTFIDQHWNSLMPERTKTATWINTIAGVLSIHSKKLFKSGQVLFNENGWWALQRVVPPNLNDVDDYKQARTYTYSGLNTDLIIKQAEHLQEYGRGKRQRKDLKSNEKEVIISKRSRSSRAKIFKKDENTPVLKIKIKVEPEENIVSNEKIVVTKADIFESVMQPIQQKIKEETFEFNMDPCMESELAFQENGMGDLLSNVELPFDPVEEMLTSQVLNEPDTASSSPPSTTSAIAENNYACNKTINKYDTGCLDSGRTSIPANIKPTDKKIIPLSPQEENEFLGQINACSITIESDPSIRRLRRKLIVRKLKREIGLKVFNLDSTVTLLVRKLLPKSMKFLVQTNDEHLNLNVNKHCNTKASTDRKYIFHPALHGVNVLDKFVNYNYSNINQNRYENKTFMQLMGACENQMNVQNIISPYTSRVLKPYIRRDFNTFPKKLKLLKEIRKHFGFNDEHCQWPIDYCYVQPDHIPSVNSLCNDFFWPGIDLTECLQYPEFSCVVLYRKLLIGFAFMVPDVNYNEAYISFILVHPDWQRAGIATYMIYHLIQTCMGKDITLHVSPTNSSMILYQKFGFKVEELILDFYDKYIPSDQPGSRHAFFLRLQR